MAGTARPCPLAFPNVDGRGDWRRAVVTSCDQLRFTHRSERVFRGNRDRPYWGIDTRHRRYLLGHRSDERGRPVYDWCSFDLEYELETIRRYARRRGFAYVSMTIDAVRVDPYGGLSLWEGGELSTKHLRSSTLSTSISGEAIVIPSFFRHGVDLVIARDTTWNGFDILVSNHPDGYAALRESPLIATVLGSTC